MLTWMHARFHSFSIDPTQSPYEPFRPPSYFSLIDLTIIQNHRQCLTLKKCYSSIGYDIWESMRPVFFLIISSKRLVINKNVALTDFRLSRLIKCISVKMQRLFLNNVNFGEFNYLFHRFLTLCHIDLGWVILRKRLFLAGENVLDALE